MRLKPLDAVQALDLVRAIAARVERLPHELGGDGERRERRLDLVGDVGEAVRERLLLALELVGGEVEAHDHLTELALEDGELALAHAREVDGAVAVEHRVDALAQARDRLVALAGEPDPGSRGCDGGEEDPGEEARGTEGGRGDGACRHECERGDRGPGDFLVAQHGPSYPNAL